MAMELTQNQGMRILNREHTVLLRIRLMQSGAHAVRMNKHVSAANP